MQGFDAAERRLKRARPAAASSGSTSAPTATAPTAWRTMSPASRASRRSPTTSPSTSPRPTRRACATCRSERRWRPAGRGDRGSAAARGEAGADPAQARARSRRRRPRGDRRRRRSTAGIDGLDRHQHDDRPRRPGDSRAGGRDRRAFRPPALPPLDRHAGEAAPAVPAERLVLDRRRRHRFGGDRVEQDGRRRRPPPALYRHWSTRGSACRPRSSPASRGALDREGIAAIGEIVGSEAERWARERRLEARPVCAARA